MKEAAELCELSFRKMKRLHHSGQGPDYVLYHNVVLCHINDVLRFKEELNDRPVKVKHRER